jgi:hypothetical protein
MLENMGINLDYFMYEGATGSLQAQIIARQPEAVKAIERFYKLPITGDYSTMIRNYNENHYTRRCRDSNNVTRCLELAVKQGFYHDVVKYLAEEDESWHHDFILYDTIFICLVIASFRGYREIVALLLKGRDPSFIGAVLIGAAGNSDYEFIRETFTFLQQATITNHIYNQCVTLAMLSATMFDRLDNLQLLQQQSLFHEPVNPRTKLPRTQAYLKLMRLQEEYGKTNILSYRFPDYFNADHTDPRRGGMVGDFRSVELLSAAIDSHSTDVFQYLLPSVPQPQSAIFRYAAEAGFFDALLYLVPTYKDMPNFASDVIYMFEKLFNNETPEVVEFFRQFIDLDAMAPLELFKIILTHGNPTALRLFLAKYPYILQDVTNVKELLNFAKADNFVMVLQQYPSIRPLFDGFYVIEKIIDPKTRQYVPSRGMALSEIYPEYFQIKLYALLYMEDYDQAVQLIKQKLRSGMVFRYIDIHHNVLRRPIINIMKMLVDQDRFDLVIEFPFMFGPITGWDRSEQLFDFHYNDHSTQIIEYTSQQGKHDAIPYLFANLIGAETGKYVISKNKTVVNLAKKLKFFDGYSWLVPSIRDVLKRSFETMDIETMIWALRRLDLFTSRPLVAAYSSIPPPGDFADFVKSMSLISVL